MQDKAVMHKTTLQKRSLPVSGRPLILHPGAHNTRVPVFQPAFFEFNPCALENKNNGNVSLKSTKYYSNISNPNVINNCTFRHVENILENSFSNKNCLSKA